MALVSVWPTETLAHAISIASPILLALLGAISAKADGSNILKATVRVTFWGAYAMTLTADIDALIRTTG